MLNAEAVIERLHGLFLERFHIDVPAPDTDLLETGMLDSLQLVELLLQIEQVFGLRIAIEAIELDELRSLARLARVVGDGAGRQN
jgi:acyl carrier protein